MSDLISREEVIKIVEDAMHWKNRHVTDRISFLGPRPMADTISDIRALPAAPALKVKPLVWSEAVSGEYKRGECYYTRSIVSVAPISASKTRDGWWLNIDCKTYPSLEAAKAAAQADYEARILAALEGGEA